MPLMTENDNIMSQLSRVGVALLHLTDEVADNDRTGARSAIDECRTMLGELSAAIDQHEAWVKEEAATHHITLTEEI